MYPIVVQDAVSEVCASLSEVHSTSLIGENFLLQSADECAVCHSPFSDSCQQPQLKLFRPAVKQVSYSIIFKFYCELECDE